MKKQTEQNKFEIRCRKLAIKKLSTGIKQLEALVEKEKQKREDEFKSLSVYETYEEIQDIYGYGEMTDDQRELAIAILENHETEMKNPTTSNSAALSILKDFISRLNREIRGFEWDYLPEDEKERISRERAEHKSDLNKMFRGEVNE